VTIAPTTFEVLVMLTFVKFPALRVGRALTETTLSIFVPSALLTVNEQGTLGGLVVGKFLRPSILKSRLLTASGHEPEVLHQC